MSSGTSAEYRSDKKGKKELLGQSAYNKIKSRILERLLQPGEALIEGRLAVELGMSRTPVRDALARLEHEGLVVSVPNKGTFVESLRPVDVAEIYDIREFIEGLAARLLARRITHGQAQVLQELSVQADNPYATVEEDSAFHSAIIRLSGSWKVMEIAQSHCLQALTYDERMHRLAAGSHTPVIVEGRVPDAHQQIACAIISGNENEAERIVREHVGLGKSIVAKRLLGL